MQFREWLVGMSVAASPLLMVPASAQAQTSADEGGELAASGGEIVVTAQKREEKLRDVPVSISVIGGNAIERTGAPALADYASYVPGLAVNSGGSPGQAQIILRGINTGGAIGASALVATYLDDTPVGSSSNYARASTFALDLMPYDLKQLEVLRGPQGTLYGAGAMGGLLKYTLQEADTYDYQVRGGALVEYTDGASAATRGARGLVNIPVVEGVLGVRASGFYQKNAGWIDNVGTGVEDYNSSTQKGGRIAATFRPSDRLEIRGSALLQDVDANGISAVTLARETLAPAYEGYANSTQLPELFAQKLRYYAVTADWDLGFASVTNAASWSRTRNRQYLDATDLYGAYAPFVGAEAGAPTPFTLDVRLAKFTEELRMASNSGGAIDWMVGGFYTSEHVRNAQLVEAVAQDGGALAGVPDMADIYSPSSFREYAGFANVTWNVVPALYLTGGLRYSRNEQHYEQYYSGVLMGGEGSTVLDSDDNVLTWLATARYALDARSNIYLRAASGYRAGGPNAPILGNPDSYASDTLINYEAGYKGTLLDDRLDIELSAFYIDWKDIQVQILSETGTTYIGNGGKASSRGFEASVGFRLTPDLKLGANTSFTDAHFDEPVASLFAQDGDRLPLSPRWTAAATLDYSRALNRHNTLTAGLAYRYRGASLTHAESNTANVLTMKAQNVVDAHLGLTVDALSLRLYARNLFNDMSYSGLYNQYNATRPSFIPIQSRTIGLSVDAAF
ncbi:TonB-dependent receptor [Novosphingobium mangrovi (ex Hu et al. 2023)]|uniref:TonB-dependent receptor n=1 Tax=Novosphingobium mangrovi (ex Hu et al. 2023) TaxID=2930094 RepID=A0ABT0ACR4_9SPHN|nr:TonB-dependent receptor [Novosphingobium mangrovi (ex Hu et al. 2023)]MCJ1960982.1 TonB-dependent receptor [Novosphingobium mangrovi (ex Hu et al. 2023)]